MTAPRLRFKEFSGAWVEKWFYEISDIKSGPFDSTLHEADYVLSDTPIISVEHLGEQGVVHQNLPLVSDDKARLKSYHLKEGDVVFSRVGSVDRSCLIRPKENGWLFSGRLLRVRLTNDNACPKFLNQNFKNDLVKYRVRSVAVGQTMASLNTEILKNFHLIFPPSKPEQTKIANFLTALDDKISLNQTQLNALKRYKKGLLQQLFV
ncbi:MAG: restriction endonuclease subunit S [Methylomicrobium sp.]|nr:restriction endonuclease subunit S [Methylomicrobium sp.]